MKTLEQLRKERGVTKAAVQRHLGVSQPTYDKYEREPGVMSVADFNTDCIFLHIKALDVVLGAEHN